MRWRRTRLLLRGCEEHVASDSFSKGSEGLSAMRSDYVTRYRLQSPARNKRCSTKSDEAGFLDSTTAGQDLGEES